MARKISRQFARVWRGVTKESRANDYLEYLKKTGLKDYSGTKGNRGVTVLRKISGGKAEFLLISFWNSMEDVERFAGRDVERAVYYPEDKEYLLEIDPNVLHYEVLLRT